MPDESSTPVESRDAQNASQAADDFARQAEEATPGLVAEFVDFLIHNKKWWLTPIILVLLLVGVLVWLSAVGAAPFIYPVF